MRMSKWVTPPGGWQFIQGDTTIMGHSFENLVAIVKTHRLNNSIPMGDVEKDIMNQLMKLRPTTIIRN